MPANAGVVALVGTDKGGFVLRSDDRAAWRIEGPVFKGWKVSASGRDASGRFWAATASDVYGPAVHVSNDLAEWRQIENGPAWPKSVERKLNQVWTLHLEGDRFWAGVDEAGLFSSTDSGETWQPVDGLNEHATREGWFPGAGGMCAHSILVDPADPQRIWVGISAVGLFRSDDGGATWATKNAGVKQVIEDKKHKDIGFCVHALAADPDDANVIYRREHTGMYRTGDGGETWEQIENGLSSWFGFPIVMDRRTRTLFCVPLESDEYRIPTDGALRVYRSRNRGDSWESASDGLPRKHAYMGVLRGAMAADSLDPCGVYFGTTAGTVHVSSNAGDTWTQLPAVLPRVLSVSVFTDA
jgi:photosystem II stability/assembly factor-like uncharacterized protein